MVSGLRIHCFAQLWIDWPQGWNTMLHSQPNVGFLPKNDLPNNFFIKLPVTWVSWVKIPIIWIWKSIFKVKHHLYYYHLNTIWNSLFPKIGPHFCRLYIHTQVNSSPIKKVLDYINFLIAKICIGNSVGCATLCPKSEVTLRVSGSMYQCILQYPNKVLNTSIVNTLKYHYQYGLSNNTGPVSVFYQNT